MVEHREYKDCVVIGGGPAGSAFAGIASRYAPEASILLLEKARFPRFRLGESTIPVANTVLRELGVYDELYNGGAVKKVGISFVWGADRMPWNADYLQIGGASEQLGPERTIDVLGQDLSTFSERFAPSRMPFVGFNVERSRFDQMLLERARVLGAECREGVGVTEILRENGVVCGVRYRDDLRAGCQWAIGPTHARSTHPRPGHEQFCRAWLLFRRRMEEHLVRYTRGDHGFHRQCPARLDLVFPDRRGPDECGFRDPSAAFSASTRRS